MCYCYRPILALKRPKIWFICCRFIEKSRSKDPEYTLNKEWPCKIEINANHNHPLKPFFCSTINSKALLKPTTTDTTTVINISVNTVVDPATITAATGTTTTSAANGITATGTIVAAVDNKTTVGAITAVDTSTTDTSLQDIPDNWFQDLQDDQNEGYCDSTSVSSLQSQSQMNNPESEDVKINLVVQSNLLNDLDKLVSWIKHGVSEKPKDFLPALHAMMNSVKRNIKTDVCLIDAMRNFGKYSRDEKIKGSGRDRKIGIKAVSISKRKNSRLTSKTVMLRSNIRHDRNDWNRLKLNNWKDILKMYNWMPWKHREIHQLWILVGAVAWWAKDWKFLS